MSATDAKGKKIYLLVDPHSLELFFLKLLNNVLWVQRFKKKLDFKN